VKHLIYAPGTQVKLIRNHILEKGRVGLIEEVSLDTGEIEYTFEGCAWFDHSDFEFIKSPTKASLKKVFAAMDSEEEDIDD
jgi:hypothetical protein